MDAIKHNSFLCPEKKLEQGNIEEAFENVDQVAEELAIPFVLFWIVKMIC